MKRLFVVAFLMAINCVILHAQPKLTAAARSDKNAPKFEFTDGATHDFGEFGNNKDPDYTFRFKNAGKTPLVVAKTSSSCTCVTSEFPHDPILPGAQGAITVTFHTKGRQGGFDKTIFIESNALSNTAGDLYELHVKGLVRIVNP
jgi:hypothetical protein